jgi:hypothetical protein
MKSKIRQNSGRGCCFVLFARFTDNRIALSPLRVEPFGPSRRFFDIIPIVDTVSELVDAESGNFLLLGYKSSKMRDPRLLHFFSRDEFFSCDEVIETKKIDSGSDEGMLQ